MRPRLLLSMDTVDSPILSPSDSENPTKIVTSALSSSTTTIMGPCTFVEAGRLRCEYEYEDDTATTTPTTTSTATTSDFLPSCTIAKDLHPHDAAATRSSNEADAMTDCEYEYAIPDSSDRWDHHHSSRDTMTTEATTTSDTPIEEEQEDPLGYGYAAPDSCSSINDRAVSYRDCSPCRPSRERSDSMHNSNCLEENDDLGYEPAVPDCRSTSTFNDRRDHSPLRPSRERRDSRLVNNNTNTNTNNITSVLHEEELDFGYEEALPDSACRMRGDTLPRMPSKRNSSLTTSNEASNNTMLNNGVEIDSNNCSLFFEELEEDSNNSTSNMEYSFLSNSAPAALFDHHGHPQLLHSNSAPVSSSFHDNYDRNSFSSISASASLPSSSMHNHAADSAGIGVDHSPMLPKRPVRRSTMHFGCELQQQQQQQQNQLQGCLGNGANRKKRRPRAGSITFADKSDVKEIEPLTDVVQQKELWFQKHDYDRFKDKIHSIVNKTKNTTDPRKKKFCLRGLEKYFDKKNNNKTIDEAKESVLKSQYQQRWSGSVDNMEISKKYGTRSSDSKLEAAQRAARDAADIEDYLKSTRRMMRRMSM